MATLTMFSTGSSEGQALKEMVVSLAEQGFGLKVRAGTPTDQLEVARACLEDDVVIFDATIEPDKRHNYHAATGHIIYTDHVLVVSRTYLPLNFTGMREGGAPSYPNPYTRSDGTFTNEQIVAWLRTQLAELPLPRSDKAKGTLHYLQAVRSASELQDQRRNARGQIFLSYRSRGLKEIPEPGEPGLDPSLAGQDLDPTGAQKVTRRLKQLEQKIASGHFSGGAGRTARYIFPGELATSNELLTEMRRWQVLTMLDRILAASDEVWVYETEDYLDSWWTQGEMVTLAYRRLSGSKQVPRLRIYDYQNDTVRDATGRYLPPMSKTDLRRMARWYANCDPAEMAPESLAAMQMYRQLPLIGRLSFFQDHVWTDEFWGHPLLQCVCSSSTTNGGRIDMQAFLWIKEPRLTPEQVAAAVAAGEVTCPVCGREYQVRETPPRYLWMPRIGQRYTDPEQISLVALPTYQTITV